LLLANQGLEDVLFFHVVGANIIAVYAAVGVALLQRCSVIMLPEFANKNLEVMEQQHNHFATLQKSMT